VILGHRRREREGRWREEVERQGEQDICDLFGKLKLMDMSGGERALDASSGAGGVDRLHVLGMSGGERALDASSGAGGVDRLHLLTLSDLKQYSGEDRSMREGEGGDLSEDDDDVDSFVTAADDLDLEYADSGDVMNSTWTDELSVEVFIHGSQSSRTDQDVLRAIDGLDPVRLRAYPVLASWREGVEAYPEEVRSRWPDRSGHPTSTSSCTLRQSMRTPGGGFNSHSPLELSAADSSGTSEEEGEGGRESQTSSSASSPSGSAEGFRRPIRLFQIYDGTLMAD